MSKNSVQTLSSAISVTAYSVLYVADKSEMSYAFMAKLGLAQEHLSGDNEGGASAAFNLTYPNVSCRSRDFNLWWQSSFLEVLGQRRPFFCQKSSGKARALFSRCLSLSTGYIFNVAVEKNKRKYF